MPNAGDNCVAIANPAQANTDAAPLIGAFSSPPPTFVPPNDHTRPNGDALGNACDDDDDNDGLTDTVEDQLGVPSPPGPCPHATAPTNPLEADTDGDRMIDGAECALGTDPADPTSKLPTIPPGDADADGLPDAFEAVLGTSTSALDQNGDGRADGLDSDLDGTRDGVETAATAPHPSPLTRISTVAPTPAIVSVNVDKVVNSIDQGIVASQFNRTDRPVQDVDKNGIVNANDLLVVGLNIGTSPC